MNISQAIRRCSILGLLPILSVTTFGQNSVYRPAVPGGFVRLDIDEIPSQTTTLYGDPNKSGIYVVRNLFRKGPGGGQPGQGSRPHYHDQDRFVTVIKGTWWVALGDEAKSYQPDKMTPMKEGSFVFHPANGVHYDGAKDEDVIVQIIGMGPVKTVNLDQSNSRGAGGGRRGADSNTSTPSLGRP